MSRSCVWRRASSCRTTGSPARPWARAMPASSRARMGGGKVRSSERGALHSSARRSRFPAIGPASTAAATAPTAPSARALVPERGVGDLPAVALTADQVGGRNAHVGEEHLVEQRTAGHLAYRADLDAGLVEVQDEVGEPRVLGNLHISASQEHRLVGDLRARAPDLLTVHDELIAVPHRPALQAGEVRSRIRLREQLAVRVGSVQHPGQMARPLVVCAVLHHGRCGQSRAQADRGRHCTELVDRPRRSRGEGRIAPAEPGDREVRVPPPGRTETGPPLPQRRGRVPVRPQPFGQLTNRIERHRLIVVHRTLHRRDGAAGEGFSTS